MLNEINLHSTNDYEDGHCSVELVLMCEKPLPPTNYKEIKRVFMVTIPTCPETFQLCYTARPSLAQVKPSVLCKLGQ